MPTTALRIPAPRASATVALQVFRAADRLAIRVTEIPRLARMDQAADPDACDLLRVLTRRATSASHGSPTDNRVESRPSHPMIALVLRIATAMPVSRHLGAQGGKSQCGGGEMVAAQKTAAFGLIVLFPKDVSLRCISRHGPLVDGNWTGRPRSAGVIGIDVTRTPHRVPFFSGGVRALNAGLGGLLGIAIDQPGRNLRERPWEGRWRAGHCE